MADDDVLIVLDCDLWFSCQGYFNAIRDAVSGDSNLNGFLVSFRSRDARYSYAAVENGEVRRTAEKIVISDRALIGAYGFQSAAIFVRAAKALLDLPPESGAEYTVSAVYNRLIAEGGQVGLWDADAYCSFGTPEELKSYLVSAAR
jgi:hypothetical protein